MSVTAFHVSCHSSSRNCNDDDDDDDEDDDDDDDEDDDDEDDDDEEEEEETTLIMLKMVSMPAMATSWSTVAACTASRQTCTDRDQQTSLNQASCSSSLVHVLMTRVRPRSAMDLDSDHCL